MPKVKISPIRIFVDCHVLDHGFQGTHTYIVGLYKEAIKNQRFQFYFAAFDVQKAKAYFGTQSNISYVSYRWDNKWLRLLWDIPNCLRKNKIDYAHFQYTVAPIKRSKYILTTHDVLFLDYPNQFSRFSSKLNSFLYRTSAKLSDVLLTVSEYSKERLSNHFSENRYKVVPNGVADIFFEAYDKEVIQRQIREIFGFSNYLLLTSRWEPRKNQELLLEAFIELKLYFSYHLILIGEVTVANPRFEEMYKALTPEIQSKVIRLTNVDSDTMLLLLRGASLFVYPSIAEGFGIPPLEAVAAKVPTICSNQTAMREFDFPENLTFNPDSKIEFHQKIIETLKQTDSDFWQQMSDNVKENFNWRKSAELLLGHLIKNEESNY